jgi:hypothetical protein
MDREFYNYNLHELKTLLKKETNVNTREYIKIALDKKIKDSQKKLFIPEASKPEDDLFKRMMAEAEGIKNIRLDEIEKPFYDNNIIDNRKTLGKRKDLF